jgi:hypothetical protein
MDHDIFYSVRPWTSQQCTQDLPLLARVQPVIPQQVPQVAARTPYLKRPRANTQADGTRVPVWREEEVPRYQQRHLPTHQQHVTVTHDTVSRGCTESCRDFYAAFCPLLGCYGDAIARTHKHMTSAMRCIERDEIGAGLRHLREAVGALPEWGPIREHADAWHETTDHNNNRLQRRAMYKALMGRT